MKNIEKIYNNLNVMLEDDKERANFKSMFDMAMKDHPREFIVVAHILYSFGKSQGKKAERSRAKKHKERKVYEDA